MIRDEYINLLPIFVAMTNRGVAYTPTQSNAESYWWTHYPLVKMIRINYHFLNLNLVLRDQHVIWFVWP